MSREPVEPTGSRLLARLSPEEYERLLPHLEHVSFALGEVIYESGGQQSHIYFPTTAIISLLYMMENGSSAEMGVAGNEGLVGIALFMGGDTVPNRAVVQSAGGALRMKTKVLQEEFAQGGTFQRLLLRYTQALMTQMSQTAVCNRLHTVEQQLCRWLLLSRDRLNSDELVMTQELIANMLGVRREGVTQAAGRLQENGMISYVRGGSRSLIGAAWKRQSASVTGWSKTSTTVCSAESFLSIPSSTPLICVLTHRRFPPHCVTQHCVDTCRVFRSRQPGRVNLCLLISAVCRLCLNTQRSSACYPPNESGWLKISLSPRARRANNMTEPNPAQKGLRSSEIRYRRLFEAARDGILILNACTLKITDVNPYMTELLGYSADEFLGRELWEIGLFNDKEASQAAFRELQETGYLRYEDLPLQTLHGETREVEFVSNVYNEDGHQVIQCNIRDISERKRSQAECTRLLKSAIAAQAEADTANGLKDEFLALLSHELRTPLTSILGWSHMLAAGNLDDAASKRALETIVRNADAQRQLIDDLLDISRIITGKLRLDVCPVELAPMIEAVVDGVRPAADARSIHLRTALDSRTGPVSGDPDRLRQIIWNLLTNAIKFTPEGGRVEAGLERTNSHVEVTISDTGQGIAPEFLPHVFERFSQSDSSSTRRHGGLGLGLSIVRQLVELHGGTVRVTSPGSGEGTTFKVIFPLMSVRPELRDREASPPLTGSSPPINRQPSLNDVRVLIVEDAPDARELVAAMLEGCGAEVVAVGSAGEALAEIERQRFDVLISDIGMPSMDGYALIEKVRRLPLERGGRIPAIALTAYAGVEDRMRMLSAGYQMHLPKPFEPIELTTVVADLAARYAVPLGV